MKGLSSTVIIVESYNTVVLTSNEPLFCSMEIVLHTFVVCIQQSLVDLARHSAVAQLHSSTQHNSAHLCDLTMSSEQLQEYQSQLQDIEALLEDDPTDESLLKLKSDLVELIALTMEDVAEQPDGASEIIITTLPHSPSVAVTACANDTTTESAVDVNGTQQQEQHGEVNTTTTTILASEMSGVVQDNEEGVLFGAAVTAAAPAVSPAEPQRKKLKKLKEFEIPAHLQILETDTEKEKNKKKRTLKSLKSKHREKQREYESTKKQQSWQSFTKKTKKSNDSIFATHDGVNSKVGVVSGGSGMTEFQERKRHKY